MIELATLRSNSALVTDALRLLRCAFRRGKTRTLAQLRVTALLLCRRLKVLGRAERAQPYARP